MIIIIEQFIVTVYSVSMSHSMANQLMIFTNDNQEIIFSMNVTIALV